MAGKVRYLLTRSSGYYARVAVPQELRTIIGKRELLEPLHPGRAEALRKLPGAVARMQATIEAARGQATSRRPAPRGRSMTPAQMAQEHYRSQNRFDDELRNSDPRYANGFFNDAYVDALIRMFEEHLEEAKPVYSITRKDVQEFKRALSETPTNYTKRFRGVPLPEAIKANKARKVPYATLNARTINNKWLSRLHGLLNWCVNNDVIPDNPATGVKVDVVREDGKPKRVNFAPDDLTKIFAAPLFEEGKPLEERHWAMLISLFSGIRPSELAQVELNSIRHERGVLVFAIEQETKNRGSQRLVPVHDWLLKRGLETHVQTLRKKGETHLFPEWYRDGMASRKRAERGPAHKATLNHYFPRFIPKRFNETLLPKIGIIDPRKNFYSFRHTFKTGLSRAGVDRSTRDYLCGHTDDSAGSVYVHDISIDVMKAAIEKLQFDGFGP